MAALDEIKRLWQQHQSTPAGALTPGGSFAKTPRTSSTGASSSAPPQRSVKADSQRSKQALSQPALGKASASRPSPFDSHPRYRITESDHFAWQRYLRDAQVTPLRFPDRVWLEPPAPAPVPHQRQADEAAVQAALLAPLSLDDWLDHDSETQFVRPGVPSRVLSDLRRGRWVIRRELDLHGLTREEARTALAAFLTAALRDGERCLRIIHGKGLRSPGGVSVLKQLSRRWLMQREEILAFCEAAPRQGGAGALLVLLKSPRAGVGGTLDRT